MEDKGDDLTEFEKITALYLAGLNEHEEPTDSDIKEAVCICERCNDNRIKAGLEVYD